MFDKGSKSMHFTKYSSLGGEWMELLSPEEIVPVKTVDSMFCGLSRVMGKDIIFQCSEQQGFTPNPCIGGGGRDFNTISRYDWR